MNPVLQQEVPFCWPGWILFNLKLILPKLEFHLTGKKGALCAAGLKTFFVLYSFFTVTNGQKQR